MKKNTYLLRGHITLMSPYATSPKGCRGSNDEQMLPRIPINAGGVFTEVPMIPASGIRGALRRSMSTVVERLYAEAGKRITLPDHLLFASGGVKGSAKTAGTVAEKPLARSKVVAASPILALMGAGASACGFVASGLWVGNAYPQTPVPTAIIAGARRAEHKSDRLVELLRDGVMAMEEYVRAEELGDLTAAKSRIEAEAKKASKAVRDARKAGDTAEADRLEAVKKDLDQQIAAIKEQMTEAGGTDNAIGRPLPGYEVLPVGLQLPHKMTISGCGEREMGLLLATLREFSFQAYLGAHRAHDCGCVRLEYEVFEEVRPTRNVIGRVVVEDGEFSVTGNRLITMENAWANGLDLEAMRADLPQDVLDRILAA